MSAASVSTVDLNITEAVVKESDPEMSLMDEHQMEQEEMEEDLDLKLQQDINVEEGSGQEKSQTIDPGKEEEEISVQVYFEHKKEAIEVEENNDKEDTAQCSEELVIAKVEDLRDEMPVEMDQTEDLNGNMMVNKANNSEKETAEGVKHETMTLPAGMQTKQLLKHTTKLEMKVAQPVQIKEEPMDEEYEKASEPQGPMENIKDEPDTAAMDTKTFYGARPHTFLGLIPENSQDYDADLSDEDQIEDPDYQLTKSEEKGDTSFESIDEEVGASRKPLSRKKIKKGKKASMAEPEDTPDHSTPSRPNKGTDKIWKYEDIEEFQVPDARLEPHDAVTTPFQYFKMLFTDKMIEHIAQHTNLYSAQELGDPIKTSPEEIEDFLVILLFMGSQ